MRHLAVFSPAAIAIAVSALVHPACAPPPKTQQPGQVAPAKGYSVKELGERLYWVTDGSYNTMFAVSNEGVIAIDPLPTLGEHYLDAIREVTDQPITYVVYSHEHTDHIGAAGLFPKTAKYVAHTETAALLASRRDPRRPVPTVTFDRTYRLELGDQTLVLDYHGVNHEAGNLFIYAPKQKVLMLIDVVYPGWMPYKNLGIGVDIPGYIDAHRLALQYDFHTLVAGHVDRLGTREDVQTSLAFVTELQSTVARSMAKTTFPAYLKATASTKTSWERHNDYEMALVDACHAQMSPRWGARLAGSESYLKDNCWAMLESLVVQFPPVEVK
ncbi:MBL fold metallo-hydrolase [Pendulispora albinea]|uniref:MBL fold metallo-hydrolase n=1 Tax=Pendulispora albinea TaxID=2741071 RepID=A0ABZ2LTN4_9BACT